MRVSSSACAAALHNPASASAATDYLRAKHPAENFVTAFAKIESDIAHSTLSYSSGLLYRNKLHGASVRPLKKLVVAEAG